MKNAIQKVLNKVTTLDANEEYVQQTKFYGGIDALLALILYIVTILSGFLFGIICRHKDTVNDYTYLFCIAGIASSFTVGLIVLFCFIRKQNLSTVGFSKTRAAKSFVMGIALLIFFVAISWKYVTYAGPIRITPYVVMRAINFLFFVAFEEEIVFRGYIGTRLFGFFTNKSLSIIIVGIMWSLSHISFKMTYYQMNLFECITYCYPQLIFVFISNFFYQWIYSKYNSIVAPTLLHFILDFLIFFVAWIM